MYRRLARTLIAFPLLVVIAALASWQLPAGGNHATTFRWTADDPRFGGFSALEVSQDGSRFTAITDKGNWLTGTLLREKHRIIGVDATPLTALRAENGEAVKVADSDSEGMALAPDGTAFVSFEQRIGIRRYATLKATPVRLPNGPFAELPFNGGLEAVALDGDTVLTIPEIPNGDTFTVWRLASGEWVRDFAIPRRGVFRVADADVLDDHLYILERAFLGLGFATRVRRFALNGSEETTLFTSRPGKFDNLEGLSVWRDGRTLVLTMISDDNFMPFERTEFVEYRFAE
ncbi:esterase-like activity of phytase family protein [Falsirhodobacter sp. alg1]|uniref:esterase-like activity of phytase family protein n=1 Tax=Falsirhodobacter sp. alg1 TaxID=1472418 RepID=UPI0006941BA1|nr:esterase-like activity of phytase family protein [Falsirhodobacter sp. alg1]